VGMLGERVDVCNVDESPQDGICPRPP
jgi:hypothetical protein